MAVGFTSSHLGRILDHSALELNRSCAKGFLDEGLRVHFRGLDPSRFCTTCIDVFGVTHYVLYDFWANIFFSFLFPHVFMLDFTKNIAIFDDNRVGPLVWVF